MPRVIEFGIGQVLLSHGIDGCGNPIVGMIEAPNDIGGEIGTPPDDPEAMLDLTRKDGIVLVFHNLDGVCSLLKHIEKAAEEHNRFITAQAAKDQNP